MHDVLSNLLILSTLTSANSRGQDSDWEEEESRSRPGKVAPYCSYRSNQKGEKDKAFS